MDSFERLEDNQQFFTSWSGSDYPLEQAKERLEENFRLMCGAEDLKDPFDNFTDEILRAKIAPATMDERDTFAFTCARLMAFCQDIEDRADSPKWYMAAFHAMKQGHSYYDMKADKGATVGGALAGKIFGKIATLLPIPGIDVADEFVDFSSEWMAKFDGLPGDWRFSTAEFNVLGKEFSTPSKIGGVEADHGEAERDEQVEEAFSNRIKSAPVSQVASYGVSHKLRQKLHQKEVDKRAGKEVASTTNKEDIELAIRQYIDRVDASIVKAAWHYQLTCKAANLLFEQYEPNVLRPRGKTDDGQHSDDNYHHHNCDQAVECALEVYNFLHHFDKLKQNIWPLAGFLNFVSSRMVAWYEDWNGNGSDIRAPDDGGDFTPLWDLTGVYRAISGSKARDHKPEDKCNGNLCYGPRRDDLEIVPTRYGVRGRMLHSILDRIRDMPTKFGQAMPRRPFRFFIFEKRKGGSMGLEEKEYDAKAAEDAEKSKWQKLKAKVKSGDDEEEQDEDDETVPRPWLSRFIDFVLYAEADIDVPGGRDPDTPVVPEEVTGDDHEVEFGPKARPDEDHGGVEHGTGPDAPISGQGDEFFDLKEQRLAQLLNHVFVRVENKKWRRRFANKVKRIWKYTKKRNLAIAVAFMAIGATVTIFTGGLAGVAGIGVGLGITVGKTLVKMPIKSMAHRFNKRKRRQALEGGELSTEEEMHLQGKNIKDFGKKVRRHYISCEKNYLRMMWYACGKPDPTADDPLAPTCQPFEFENCLDAGRYLWAQFKFMHHLEKLERYLLPAKTFCLEALTLLNDWDEEWWGGRDDEDPRDVMFPGLRGKYLNSIRECVQQDAAWHAAHCGGDGAEGNCPATGVRRAMQTMRIRRPQGPPSKLCYGPVSDDEDGQKQPRRPLRSIGDLDTDFEQFLKSIAERTPADPEQTQEPDPWEAEMEAMFCELEMAEDIAPGGQVEWVGGRIHDDGPMLNPLYGLTDAELEEGAWDLDEIDVTDPFQGSPSTLPEEDDGLRPNPAYRPQNAGLPEGDAETV